MESRDPGGSAEGITAIILAAGANTRLAGIVPAHMKPLLLVNGKPLVRHAWDHAHNDWSIQQKIIVASPDNVKMLTEVLPVHDTHFVIQRAAMGFEHAILSTFMPNGHSFFGTKWMLILCADNTFSMENEIPSFKERLEFHKERALFGARQLSLYEARRFTRFKWREPNTGVEWVDTDSQHVWIGPMKLETAKVYKAITDGNGNSGVTEFLKKATNYGNDILPISMRCEDLGVPEAL